MRIILFLSLSLGRLRRWERMTQRPTNGRLPVSKASSYSDAGPNKHSLQSRVVGFMTLLMQCNSTRHDATAGGRRRRDEARARARAPNSCPLRIQPLCGRVAGSPYITYVDSDQDHSAPFMYETPAYNTLLSLARGTPRVGGGIPELNWSPTVFSNYPSFRTRFSPANANAYKYIC